MSLAIAPIASDAPIIASDPNTNRLTGNISTFFRQWLLIVTNLLQAAIAVQGTPFSQTINAALLTTTICRTTQAGLYQVMVYGRVTVPDGVASSFQVTIGWLEHGVALTRALTLVNGDLVTSQDDAIRVIYADATSNITIASTYASTTANKMHALLKAAVALVA